MGCEIYREALSARLDGEAMPVGPDALERHLRLCTGCRQWESAAGRLRRAMMLREAPPVPDLTDRIVPRPAARLRARRWLRRAIAVVGALQVTLGLLQVFGAGSGMTGMHGQMMGHLTHEGAAWNLAVGIGFLWAALRTESARGQLPVVTGFVAILTVLSVTDLVDGAVTIGRLSTHLVMVLGLALLYALYRVDRTGGSHSTAVEIDDDVRTAIDALVDRPDRSEHERPWRRPASRAS